MGLKLRIQIEPLVCKLKNKFYRIKTHRQKWLNCLFPTLSAVILRHYSLIHTNYRCGWKDILVDYIFARLLDVTSQVTTRENLCFYRKV